MYEYVNEIYHAIPVKQYFLKWSSKGGFDLY